jgi:hypothetical protein
MSSKKVGNPLKDQLLEEFVQTGEVSHVSTKKTSSFQGESSLVTHAPDGKPGRKAKHPRERVVRDTFTMSLQDNQDLRSLIGSIAKATGVIVTKSELVRVGIHVLKKMSPTDITKVLSKEQE